MIYGFDTNDDISATAALLLYAVYRSRDKSRFKVTPDMWSQIERFAKAASKRAQSIPQFLEALKPKLSCGTIHPKTMAVGIKGLVARESSYGFTEYIQRGESREFLTAVVGQVDQQAVVTRIYKETAWVVLLVRDRLEREKPVESEIESFTEEESL